MKSKTLLILNIIFIALSVVLAIILGAIFKFDIRFYYAALFTIMGISIGNLLFILLGFLVVKGYDITTFRLAREGSLLVVAVGAYYAVKYLAHYDEFFLLYWLITFLLVAFLIVLFIILDKKEKKKEANKPRIVANKNR